MLKKCNYCIFGVLQKTSFFLPFSLDTTAFALENNKRLVFLRMAEKNKDKNLKKDKETKNFSGGKNFFDLAAAQDSLDRYTSFRKAAGRCAYSRDYIDSQVKRCLKSTPLRKTNLTFQNRHNAVNKSVLEKIAKQKQSSTLVDFKKSELGKEDDFYLWLSAFVFLIFFAVFFGRGSIWEVWIDFNQASKQAAVNLGGDNLFLSAETKLESNEAIYKKPLAKKQFSVFLAGIKAIPALPEESFYPAKKMLGRASEAVFFDKFKEYGVWLKEELSKKLSTLQ